jgi:hypothetical protein
VQGENIIFESRFHQGNVERSPARASPLFPRRTLPLRQARLGAAAAPRVGSPIDPSAPRSTMGADEAGSKHLTAEAAKIAKAHQLSTAGAQRWAKMFQGCVTCRLWPFL